MQSSGRSPIWALQSCQELRRRAAARFRTERPDHTLQPTALVHEVFLRLVNQKQIVWQNRAQFLGVASEMMRRILVDPLEEASHVLDISVATVERDWQAARAWLSVQLKGKTAAG